MEFEPLSGKIIGAALEVHKIWGPGMLESTYEECLSYELRRQGLSIERQKPVPIIYKDIKLDCGYRIDLLIEDKIIIELKSVDRLAVIHEAQLLTYIRMARIKIGILINFNVAISKNGIRRYVL
jgi:GxxExxY protein